MANNLKTNMEADRIISGLFNIPEDSEPKDLRRMFEQRLLSMQISETAAMEIMQIERRGLDGILDGTQKRVDYTSISKLAEFLGITKPQLISLYVEKLEKNFGEDVDETKKRKFIQDNFDLKSLQKVGFIDSITDYNHIENTIVSYFEFDSIYDYRKNRIDIAYSSGTPKPKNTLNRDLWIESAAFTLKKINNYYDYDRNKLIEFFPEIAWYSMNVEKGLFQVIRELFKLGVTVIFESYLPTMYVRGATFAINGKPCVVITNYTTYYPSLWFALIHELHHVLYNWEEIKINTYEVSGELDLFTMNEVEADDFAREYLFPREKMNEILPHIDNKKFITKYAKENHVHPSTIYLFYSFDNRMLDKKVWKKYTKEMPEITDTLQALGANPWQKRKPIREAVKDLKSKLFNNL